MILSVNPQKSRFSHTRLAGALLVIGLLATACSPIVHSHGYTPRGSELDNVRIGKDTRQSVQNKLGRPSTIGSFDDSDWYYISMRSEQLAFYEAEVVDQQVVTVSFDDTGMVSDVNQFGLEDGRVIDLVTRETPTGGRKLTLLQQIFQNVGRFSGQNLIASPSSSSGGILGK